MLSLACPAGAAPPERDGHRTLAIGIIAHDRGPWGDTHESGVDLNLELLFAPIDLSGTLRPHLGATLNFTGDTSMAYAGFSIRAYDRRPWFADLLLSLALHDGPLHKEPVRCQEASDCGFGVRLMPRFGLEVGYRLNPTDAVTLFIDHMSHKWVVGGENEGLDHVGVRFMRAF
ncbi:MAG: acyloxyacyl hydrolase [Thiobacillus sp.]